MLLLLALACTPDDPAGVDTGVVDTGSTTVGGLVLDPVQPCTAPLDAPAWTDVAEAWGLGLELLRLRYSAERSSSDRALLYVVGGLLARTREGSRGRLELREALGGRVLLAAIHDFEPALP